MNTKYGLCELVLGVAAICILLDRSLIALRFVGVQWWCLLAAVALTFLLVKNLLLARGRESIWVFLITFIATVSFNVKVSRHIIYTFLPYMESFLKGIYMFGIFLGILAIEEIAMGIPARVIWKRQRRTVIGNPGDGRNLN